MTPEETKRIRDTEFGALSSFIKENGFNLADETLKNGEVKEDKSI